MWITLVPRKADLVAVLETAANRVGYEDTIVLRADKSYDPDRVQVFAGRLFAVIVRVTAKLVRGADRAGLADRRMEG